MAKTFREWPVDQAWLLPPSVRELLPASDPAHFVRDVVREQLDLSAILSTYTEERGYPPYHPAMLTALILFGYTQGVYSSRKIARGCHARVDFMAVTAMQKPDFRTISDFRLRHLEALSGLFQQVLLLCCEAGLVKLGHVALDGTKVKANASKHKAMSYARMKKTEQELQAEIASWFEKAKQADEEEDGEFGDRQGDVLPEWVTNKQQRLEKIQAAKARLEAQAKAQLAAGMKPELPKPDDDGPDKPPRGRSKKRPKPNGEPHDKAQLNFTDPDSKILKTKNGFEQGYNCQAAVDAHAQVVVAHAVEAAQNDVQQLVPMVKQIRENLGRNPEELSADNGYLSEANLAALEKRRIEGYVAAGREKKHQNGRPKLLGTRTRRMKRKLKQGGYRSRYRLRKQTVEPVFGQIKAARGFRSMSMRGITKAQREWALVCTAHNLLKLAKR
ncbi:MAG: IS1182 family transposase [Deltaproteobacteria bacterium]|nr:IS1182 family transposase [Deltaproteobacteria bacterium]